MIDGIIGQIRSQDERHGEKLTTAIAEEGIFDVSGMFFATPKRPLPIMSQPPPKRRKIQQPWEMQQQPWAVQQQAHYSPTSLQPIILQHRQQHRPQPILQRRQQHTLQRRQQHILQHRRQHILQRRQPILQRRQQPILQRRPRNLNHQSQHMHPHHPWLVIKKM